MRAIFSSRCCRNPATSRRSATVASSPVIVRDASGGRKAANSVPLTKTGSDAASSFHCTICGPKPSALWFCSAVRRMAAQGAGRRRARHANSQAQRLVLS